MKKNKQKILLKKAMSYALATTFLGTSFSVFAQQASGVPSPVNSLTPEQPVASNPFGSVPSSEKNVQSNVNYGKGVNNIDAKYKPAPTQMVDPMAAQEQTMGTPEQPPLGLPKEVSTESLTQVDLEMGVLNASKERIRKIKREMYEKGRVLNEGPVVAPRTNSGVIVAHLSPGSTSPVIRLSKNRTSTLIVTDMAGQPWPILNHDGLSDEDFIVKRLDNPAPDGYVLSITPRGSFVSGNLVLILKGLPTPLNVEFVSAQKEVDVSTEIRVQAKGPNTQLTSIGIPSSIDSSLLSVLQGVAPSDAKELKVSTNAVQAWLAKDGSMYVRTRYKIMSPAFDNVTSSPDGTYAYKMIPVPVVLFKVDDGRFGEFSVDGFN